MKRSLVVSLVCAMALVGCKKDAPAAGGGGASAPAAPPATKIEQLGLSIDVKTPAEIMPMGDMFMVQANGFVVSVSEVKAGSSKPDSLEKAVEDAQIYTPTVTKKEKTADGWVLQFNNKGDMGANFFAQVRRTIDGKAYECSTTGQSQEQSDLAVAACATLRK